MSCMKRLADFSLGIKRVRRIMGGKPEKDADWGKASSSWSVLVAAICRRGQKMGSVLAQSIDVLAQVLAKSGP